MSIVKAWQKIGQESAKELSKVHERFILGYLLVSKDLPKNAQKCLVGPYHSLTLRDKYNINLTLPIANPAGQYPSPFVS